MRRGLTRLTACLVKFFAGAEAQERVRLHQLQDRCATQHGRARSAQRGGESEQQHTPGRMGTRDSTQRSASNANKKPQKELEELGLELRT